jgi:hypothetical protein
VAAGVVAVSVFASGWEHPAKRVVDDVLARHGYVAPEWHREVKSRSEPEVGTAGRLRDVALAAGLTRVDVDCVDVTTELDVADAVRWRWSMASHAAFVGGLAPDVRALAWDETRSRLTACWEPVVVPMLALVAGV